jgi:hypothetical protein
MINGNHSHLCDECGQEYQCPFVTHCKRDRPGYSAICPTCLDQLAERPVEIQDWLTAM